MNFMACLKLPHSSLEVSNHAFVLSVLSILEIHIAEAFKAWLFIGVGYTDPLLMHSVTAMCLTWSAAFHHHLVGCINKMLLCWWSIYCVLTYLICSASTPSLVLNKAKQLVEFNCGMWMGINLPVSTSSSISFGVRPVFWKYLIVTLVWCFSVFQMFENWSRFILSAQIKRDSSKYLYCESCEALSYY